MARLLSADVVTLPSGWRPRGASLTKTLSPSRCAESGKRGSPSEAESNHLENELANGREEAFTSEGQDGPWGVAWSEPDKARGAVPGCSQLSRPALSC